MAESPALAERLEAAVSAIDDTIRQVRVSIFELGSAGDGVRAAVLALVRDLTSMIGFPVPVSFEGPIDAAVPDQVADHLLATIREALTNVGRHAHATAASVALSVEGGVCRLVVVDNGRGPAGAKPGDGGLGLVNLRSRAEKLDGEFSIEHAEIGTTLRWQVPLGR